VSRAPGSGLGGYRDVLDVGIRMDGADCVGSS